MEDDERHYGAAVAAASASGWPPSSCAAWGVNPEEDAAGAGPQWPQAARAAPTPPPAAPPAAPAAPAAPASGGGPSVDDALVAEYVLGLPSRVFRALLRRGAVLADGRPSGAPPALSEKEQDALDVSMAVLMRLMELRVFVHAP